MVEIFIDGNNSKGTTYDGVNDFQLGFRWNDAVVKAGGNSVQNTTGITFSMYASGAGYVLEAAIPWSTIGVTPVTGNQIGFDVSVDDDDNGGTRDAQMASFATTSAGWSNPSLFGSVYLTTCSTQTVPVTGVSVSPTSATLSVGGTQQLTRTISPANATNQNVTWSSSNTSVATVNSSGLVTAVAAGTATITVTTQEGNFTATSAITVNTTNVPVTGVSVSPTSATLNVGGTQQLTRTISPANATNQNVTWSSNNTSVATVNSSGLVTSVAAGSATITVTTQDGGFTATSSITVNSGGGSLPSPWTSSDVGSVGMAGSASHSSGTFTAVGSGADIWGTADAFRYVYQQVSGDVTLTARVVSMTNTDGWAKAGVMMRNTLTNNSQHALTAVTISNGLAFQRRLTSGAESQHTGGGAGSAPYWVRLQRSGSTFTSFVSTNGTSWTQVGSVTITMNASIYLGLAVTSHNNSALCTATFDNVSITTGGVAVTGVSVSPTSASIAVGATQQLTRTITPSNATNQNVTWSSSNTSVATVNSSGLVTGVAAGSATITVTTQDGNRTATSAITVTGGGSGPTQYRIRNVWQNTYLYDAGDRVRYSATASGTTYQWILEDVGGGFVELKNVGTGEYMHIENLLGYVQCTSRTFGWYSSRWAVEDAGNGERRLRNAWQSSSYQHVENLQNQVQYGTINTAWASAKWVLEPVSGSRLSESPAISNENSLSIYPNPVIGDKITVEFDGQLDNYSEIRLLDLSGVLILSQKVDGNRTELSRGSLKSGIYLLQFQSGETKIVRRIVIQ